MEERRVLAHTGSVRIHRARLNGDRLSPNRDAAFDYVRESALPRFLRSFSFHFLFDDQRFTLQRGLAQESYASTGRPEMHRIDRRANVINSIIIAFPRAAGNDGSVVDNNV